MNTILRKHFMEQHHSGRTHKRGYVTLISVLIALSLGSAIAFSVVLLGVGSSRDSITLDRSYKAKALADACAEEGLQQIRSSTPFTGTGNLSFGQGTCSYTVTNTGGTTRSISAAGVVSNVTRRVTVTISAITPKLVISSWQETN